MQTQTSNQFKFINKSLYLSKLKILIISDLHIGFEYLMNKQGLHIPLNQYQIIISDLKKTFKQLKQTHNIKNQKHNIKQLKQENNIKTLNKIIILGDLKHEFHTISKQEHTQVSELLNFLQKHTKQIILIKGNHDTILEPIIKNFKNIKIKEFHIQNNIAFIHGHKFFSQILNKNINHIVLGHTHPAITLTKNIKSETYKCFLTGTWKAKSKQKPKQIIILPSFFPLTEGSDISFYDTNLAPELNLNIKNFNVHIIGDKIYDFGKFEEIE